MKWQVRITDRLVYTYEVEADSAEEAREKVGEGEDLAPVSIESAGTETEVHSI